MNKNQYYTITAALFGIWGQLIPEPMKTACIIVSIFSAAYALVCGVRGK